MWTNCILACLVLAVPLSLQNGDFRRGLDGWKPIGQCKLIPNGGRNGAPAVEIECGGDGTSAALQVIKLPSPRKGRFVVTAWMRLDQIGYGGVCSVWLDVLQSGGPPMWGIQAEPEREAKGWQQVRAEVSPTHGATEVQVYLIMRDVRGRVRFCDVQVNDSPLSVRDFRVYPAGGLTYDVRANLSDSASWTVTAEQNGKQAWSSSGTGNRVAERFAVPSAAPVKVNLRAELEGEIMRASAIAKPRSARSAFDWWIADSFTRVFQDDLPPVRSDRQAKLDAARNDRESFQICLRPTGAALKSVRVSVSDLVSGKRVIPRARIDWFRVGYVWVEQPLRHPLTPRTTSAWWPEPLLPACEFSVQSADTQPLWFTVNVPPDAPHGVYKGMITIAADSSKPVSVPVSLTVYRASVPDQGHMKTAFSLMDWHLKKVYGEITPQLRRAYTDFLLAHHLNPDDISRTALPDLDELSYANTRGLNAFNILNVVPEPTSDAGWVCYSLVNAYTPEFKKRFFERLDKFVPELEKRGLIDKAYVYGFDERGPEYIPIMRDLFGEIKRRYPRVHTLSTCWPPAGTDPASLNIDWYVPLSSSYDPALASQVRKRGGEMWWYICCAPNYPYANWELENPLIEARLIWWQAFDYDVEGFLYWGITIWERKNNDKPIPSDAGPHIDWSVTTTGVTPPLNGDGVLVFPGEHGPIGSIRLENIRDGLEDIELLRQYKQRFGPLAAEKLVRQVLTDRTHYTRDQSRLLKARLAALKALK